MLQTDKNNFVINVVLTISEASELEYTPSKRALRAIFERGISFKHGIDVRKAGGTWLVTKESIEREYKDPS